MIKAIVAVDKNWAIGKNNQLLFRLPDDMDNFKNETINDIVVMGYNTFLSLPKKKPLKDRTNIVLCPPNIWIPEVICYHNFDELMHDLELLSITNTVWIIGGAMLYNAAIDWCQEVLVTKVEAEDKDATAFFPNLDKNENYKVIYESYTEKDNGYDTYRVLYERIKNEN